MSRELLAGLLLTSNGLLGTLAGTGILLGVLTTNGQTTAMTNTTVAADFHQALDVQGNLTAEVAFHLQVLFDVITQLADLILGEILHSGVGIDADLRENLLGSGQADTLDIGQADFHALFSGQVYARNACHVLKTPPYVATAALAAMEEAGLSVLRAGQPSLRETLQNPVLFAGEW